MARADCEDCAWSLEGEDIVQVSDEADRHARKEMHSVDVRRVATDGGRPAWVADCEDCEFRKLVEEGNPTRTIDERATDIGHGHGSTLDHEVEVRPADPDAVETHHCDICNSTFHSLVDLIEHECDEHREVATDGGVDFWIISSTSGRSGDRALHTEEDCHYLQQANTYRPTSRDEYPDKEICTNCRDDRPNETGPHTLHDAALEASPDDLATDGGQCVCGTEQDWCPECGANPDDTEMGKWLGICPECGWSAVNVQGNPGTPKPQYRQSNSNTNRSVDTGTERAGGGGS